MEYRMDMRIPLRTPVLLVSRQGHLDGETLDLSFEGAKVRLSGEPEAAVAVGETVRLHLDPERHTMSLPARVARREDGTVGLAFGQYAAPVEAYLGELIAGFLSHRQNGGQRGP